LTLIGLRAIAGSSFSWNVEKTHQRTPLQLPWIGEAVRRAHDTRAPGSGSEDSEMDSSAGCRQAVDRERGAGRPRPSKPQRRDAPLQPETAAPREAHTTESCPKLEVRLGRQEVSVPMPCLNTR
jgi:hypothetical protein